MVLDLRDIIGSPGRWLSFDYAPAFSGASYGSVIAVRQPARAAGRIENSAGALKLSAELTADCICVCARCLVEFDRRIHQQISVYLAAQSDDEGGSDFYSLRGDCVDADEIIESEFILELDDRMLCREDCAGLCATCGADLNDGGCACKPEIDPRLEALGAWDESS